MLDTKGGMGSALGIALRLIGVIVVAVASKIWLADLSDAVAEHVGRPSVLIGIAMITILITVFGGLFYWLYLSPMKTPVVPNNSESARRMRRIVGTVLVFSSLMLAFSGSWDALWHVWLGGFGNDFLWPPHMGIYGSFLIDTAVAGIALGSILFGKGDPRLRARQEPALGIAALASAYLIFSLPSDLVWHQIYGVDITAFSLPHVLITVMSIVLAVASTGLLMSGQEPGKPNRFLKAGMFVVVGGAVTTALILVGSQYEWGLVGTTEALWLRPGWVYPLLVYLVGLGGSLLIVHLTEMPGSATITALLILAGRLLFAVGASTLAITDTLRIASHAFIILPAIGFDLYFWRIRREPPTRQRAFRLGLVYCLVYWPVAIAVTNALNTGPSVTLIDAIVGVGLGILILVAFGVDVPDLVRGLRGGSRVVQQASASSD